MGKAWAGWWRSYAAICSAPCAWPFWSASAGSSALVARLGGDEFAALVSVGETASLADALRRTFEAPFALSTGPWEASGTVGAAVAHPDQSPDDVMAAADAAMYRAKPARQLDLGSAGGGSR